MRDGKEQGEAAEIMAAAELESRSPSRSRIFHAVGRLGRPTVAALAAEVHLHENAVRQQLERLIRAGMVRVEPVRRPTGPGRPPRRYALTAQGQEVARGRNPLAAIVRVLLAVVRRQGNGAAGAAEAEAAALGRELGEEAPARRKGALLALYVHLEQSGCGPAVTRSGKSGFEITLERCPFRESALLDPDLVCQIHAGMLRGFLEALPARCRLAALQAEAPEAAGCRVRVSAEQPGR